jgi:hypothetical protein
MIPVSQDDPHQWEAFARNPDGTEFMLNNWLPVTISLTVDGRGMSYTTPDLNQAAQIFPLITEIYLFRDRKFFDRYRVVDDDDNLDTDKHTVTFQCSSYEVLLDRRLLHIDWVDKQGDQNNLAWDLITHTQNQQTLGITRGNAAPHGKNRSRTIRKGTTIKAAMNDLAETEGGFDWWIDKDLKFWTQSPTRVRVLNRDLGWGSGFAKIHRTGSPDEYASRVMTIGALDETTIPGSTGGPNGDGVYPPPTPQVYRAATMPFGLWERAFSYSDVVTEATLKNYAAYNLTDLAALDATYKCVFEPGVWEPDQFQVGDQFTLHVSSPPRLDKVLTVNIEEISIEIGPNGEETVTLMVRSDTPEVPDVAGVLPPVASIPGETVIPDVPGSGRTRPKRRIEATAEWAAMLAQLSQRVRRTERS